MGILAIPKWAEEDRPREKLRDKGAETLSKAELLAILIGSGTPKKTAVELMQEVLDSCGGNLNTLGKMTVHDLMRFDGIGEAKAITILAACEFGKRRQSEKAADRENLDSAEAVYNYMHDRLQDKEVEEAWCLMMNRNFKLIRDYRLSQGGLTETAVDVRLIIREAVLCNATVLALCHNHPSGNTTPSRNDDDITLRVKTACETMRIHFLDHVIVTDGDYYSYRDNGRL